jgi:YrbI family 3-deoxy-D-manno-octulosonate 8-phosphate phosphatase
MNIVFDFDGVFTDGNFIYSNEGKVLKVFGPHDSDGLKILKSSNFDVQIITADERGYDISSRRLQDMGYDLSLVKESNRFDWIKKNHDLDHLVYMADGIWDINILKNCKFSICPFNAPKLVKNYCDFVTLSKGGDGAVLEASLEILKRFNQKHYLRICMEIGLDEKYI